MSTVFDLNKKTNFFEGRVIEYRSGSDLKWGDDN
jgi:ribonucleotide reductase beta subunit family protein with ferritin-like domain